MKNPVAGVEKSGSSRKTSFIETSQGKIKIEATENSLGDKNKANKDLSPTKLEIGELKKQSSSDSEVDILLRH